MEKQNSYEATFAKKLLPVLTLIFLVILIGISTYNLNKKQEIASQENMEESNVHFVKTHLALPEFSLPDLFDENKNFSRKNLEGKYSVINFFASWCTTCRAEHEILLRLGNEKIIDIYGIVWRDIDQNTKDYLKKSGNPFKTVAKDSQGLFTKIAGISAIPETWIVNPKGDVIARYRGNLQDFSIDEIRNFIK